MPFPGAVAIASGGAGAPGAGASLSWNPVGLAIAAVMILWSILGQPRGKDRRVPGFGFHAADNNADPNSRMDLVYGAPRFVPRRLMQHTRPASLNSNSPISGEGWVGLFSLGGGPIDGKDLLLWANDLLLLSTVSADSAAVERTLTPVDSAKTKYAFPKSNVVPESVAVYVDGTLAGVYDAASGLLASTMEVSVGPSKVALQTVKTSRASSTATSIIDDTVPANVVRYGGRFPREGVVDPGCLIVTVLPDIPWRNQAVVFRSRSAASVMPTNAPAADVHIGKDKDGAPYFWVDVTKGAAGIRSWEVTYRVKPTIRVLRDSDGTTYAIFESSQGSSVVTATYKTQDPSKNIRWTLRTGAESQDEVPLPDGVRNEFSVGLELVQATLRRYSTTNDVEDVVIGIHGDSAGFYDLAINGSNAGDYRPASRTVAIRLKESAAPDARVAGTDPSKGWIALKSASGKEEFVLSGTVNGTAKWAFSVADLLAYARGTKWGQTGNRLPEKKYDVEVVASDKANADSRGNVLDRIRSALFFATATEVGRPRLSLPHHATLAVEIDDVRDMPSEPVFAIQCAGRRCWVPESGATYSATTERPEPGAFVWTRNPIWCACDHIADPVFGGGQWWSWLNIDLTTALAAAAFCDATVATETRAELDTVIREPSAMWDHVAQMLAGSQVLPALSGGKWRFVVDRDSASVMTLTDADFERGTLSVLWPSLEEIPTELEAAFSDESQGFELDVEYARIPGADPARHILRRVDLTGVRRRSQARRALELVLRQFDRQKKAVEGVGAGWRMLALEAGDVVTLTSVVTGDTAEKYRVALVGWGSNRKPVIRLAEYDSSVYNAPAAGPAGAVLPGNREPSGPTPQTALSFIGLAQPGANLRLAKLELERVS